MYKGSEIDKNTTLNVVLNGKEINYNFAGLKIADDGKLSLLANVKIDKDQSISGLTYTEHYSSNDGTANNAENKKDSNKFAKDHTLSLRQESNGLITVTNTAKGNKSSAATVKVSFNAEEALSKDHTVSTGAIEGFDRNTLVTAENTVSIAISGSSMHDNLQIKSNGTLELAEGSSIEIYNEGGILANLSTSKGAITIKNDAFQVYVAGSNEPAFTGTRTLFYNNGQQEKNLLYKSKVSIDSHGALISGLNVENATIMLEGGRYIDLKSYDFSTKETFAKKADNVQTAIAGVAGLLVSSIIEAGGYISSWAGMPSTLRQYGTDMAVLSLNMMKGRISYDDSQLTANDYLLGYGVAASLVACGFALSVAAGVAATSFTLGTGLNIGFMALSTAGGVMQLGKGDLGGALFSFAFAVAGAFTKSISLQWVKPTAKTAVT
jgi:hypothetical protein